MNMNIFEAVWEARTPLIWGFYWDGEYMQLTRFGWNCLWPDEDPEALARAGCVVQWRGTCLTF